MFFGLVRILVIPLIFLLFLMYTSSFCIDYVYYIALLLILVIWLS